DVLRDWDWQSPGAGAYPALAMPSARLGRPAAAAAACLRDTGKNHTDRPGHFPQRRGRPPNVPANGAALLPLALVSAGWDGGPAAPGLPAAWPARWEGLRRPPGPLPPA